jgi:hypothetical protein
MPVLLFQIALLLIIIHAGSLAWQSVQGGRQNWFEFSYQVAIIVVALWFLLQHL